MGYCVDQVDSNFRIKKENIPKAWKALRKLMTDSDYEFGFVDKNDVLEAQSFEIALGECRWDITFDSIGDCNNIWFSGEKYTGTEVDVLEAIAPFVESGSYIHMRGEDSEAWIWYFTNGTVTEQNPMITWR